MSFVLMSSSPTQDDTDCIWVYHGTGTCTKHSFESQAQAEARRLTHRQIQLTQSIPGHLQDTAQLWVSQPRAGGTRLPGSLARQSQCRTHPQIIHHSLLGFSGDYTCLLV